MKRVCFLLNNEFVHDNRVRREALTLTQAGYDVTLLCTQHAKKPLPPFEDKEGFKVYRFFKRRFNSFKAISKRHVEIVNVLSRFPRFDIVHAHDLNTLLLGWALARFWRAKLVYDSHEWWESVLDYHGQQLKKKNQSKSLADLERLKRLEQRLLPQCDAVISVCDSISELLSQKAGGKLKRLATIRNMPEAPTQQLQRSSRIQDYFNISPDRKIILYQGSITTERGIVNIMDALEHLQRSDVDFILMGPFGDQALKEKCLERISRAVNARNRIFYKETVHWSELMDWTASADLGLAPILNCRLSYYLCLPNKLFEYVQAGIPCATSNFPEMSKMVNDYGIGITFDPENVDEIAQTIDRFFAEDPNQYQANVQKARQELHWQNEEKKLTGLYASLER